MPTSGPTANDEVFVSTPRPRPELPVHRSRQVRNDVESLAGPIQLERLPAAPGDACFREREARRTRALVERDPVTLKPAA